MPSKSTNMQVYNVDSDIKHKKKQVNPPIIQIDSDESDSNDEILSIKSDLGNKETKPIKNKPVKKPVKNNESDNEETQPVKNKPVKKLIKTNAYDNEETKPIKNNESDNEETKPIKYVIYGESDLDNEESCSIKIKETFEDLVLQYDKYKNKISKIFVLLTSQLVEIKKYEKNIDNIVNKMTKLHGKKNKTRKSISNNGFNKEVPVPEILINFLNLDSTILSRPKVGSLLTQKFKELGLKTGQYIQLDKDTINKLELDDSYLEPIKQTYFQTLLATFYKK
jgi:hypothetical protein